ncbi:MAG: hypothetical protein LR008_01360 [Candidatus Pacebacteria bacterium]|nr:hypothetical protein [Candidatus Paceibacterota bacterium]
MTQTITLFLRSTKSIVLSIILTTAVLAVLFGYGVNQVDSSATDNVAGYAWSSNIGWISFNCTDSSTCGGSAYGVDVSAVGLISGYAWSDNIGWISFNSADVAGCPSGSCNPSLDQVTGDVTGWARALSAPAAGVNSGGWDGWISLSGAGYGISVSGPSSGCTWGGFAWGSDVVGWVDFTGVTGIGEACNEPSGNIAVTGCVIPTGNSSCNVTVTWNSANFLGGTSVLQGAVQISADTNHPGTGLVVSADPDTDMFTLNDTLGTFVRLANANVSCSGVSIWTGASCGLLPTVTLGSNSNIIRSGETADISIGIDSNYGDLVCTMYGALTGTFTHDGTVTPFQNYSYTTSPLSSSQVVRIDCASAAFPMITTSEEIRIEVIPTIEEV